MSDRVEGVLSVPPATVAAISLAGVSLQDGVLVATMVWLTLQIGWFFYQRIKEWKERKRD